LDDAAMKEFDEQRQGRGRRGGAGVLPAESSGWVFGGFWLLLLAGTVLVGGPWAGFHGLMLGAAGLLMGWFRPVVALPRVWWLLAGVFVVAGMAPFLPAWWFAMPAWRGRLAELGVPTGSLVTIQPWQSAEMLALFAVMLFTGLWLAGHRATPVQLRRWGLAFTLGVACYAILAKIMQPPPVSEIPGGGVVYGFFPNRNHTGTYLAMGVICGLGCVFQAIRDKRWPAAAGGLLGAGVCLWAVAGWSISRGGLVLTALGCLAWLLLAGTRNLGKSGRWGVALVALGVGGFLVMADSAAKRRLAHTLDQAGAALTQDEPAPATGPRPEADAVVDLDFRIPIVLDSLGVVRDFSWTGIGAGQFFHVFPQYRRLTVTRNDSDCFHPDNDWLWMLAETGPVATLALLGLVVLAFWRSLRGVLRGRDRALRGACLVAAMVVPIHGWFDVPGHRLTLAWSAAFLYCLSLGPPAAGAVRRAFAAWPSRLVAVAMLVAAGWLGWAQWGGGPQPAQVAAQVAVDQALEWYAQDQALQQAAVRRGETYQPEPSEDLLEKALALLDRAARRAPLDRDIPHVRGLLALQFDDKLDQAEHSFAVGRALDPTWVSGPLRQAAALGNFKPAAAAELWREALRRAGQVDLVKPGTVWGREYTLGRIQRSAKGNPALEALVPLVE
jgi:O-antigen ligase